MNGLHDLGGMHGFGPIPVDELTFHAEWERRTQMISLTLGALGLWGLDLSRATIEDLPPTDYARMSYYERWLARIERNLIEDDLATAEEIEGVVSCSAIREQAPVTGETAHTFIKRPFDSKRSEETKPVFRVGDHVKFLNINPRGHTRLPRYARGQKGRILEIRGVFIYPDSAGRRLGENPQWLYSVEISQTAAMDDCGEPNTTIVLDAWEPYMIPVAEGGQ